MNDDYYTHCKITSDSIELLSNEVPPLSLDGQWWIIRREVVEGVEYERLTIVATRELMRSPEWSVAQV